MPSIHDPLIQSLVMPLFASFIAIALLRLATGIRQARVFAGALIGFVATILVIVIVDLPSFPTGGAVQKLVYLLALATLVAAILPALPGFRRHLLPLMFTGIVWIAWPLLAQGKFDGLGLVLAIAILLALLFRRAAHAGAGLDLIVFTMVMLIALSIAAISLDAVSTCQIAATLAAATGGFLLWNWPVARHHATPALLVTLPALAALATQMTLFTRADYWPALVIVTGITGHECARIFTRTRPVPFPQTLVIQTLLPAIGVAIPLALMTLNLPASSSQGY